jgi:hypothetical protein
VLVNPVLYHPNLQLRIDKIVCHLFIQAGIILDMAVGFILPNLGELNFCLAADDGSTRLGQKSADKAHLRFFGVAYFSGNIKFVCIFLQCSEDREARLETHELAR